ncbi:MAG: hypothetical protein AAF664_12485 [Planctomycetota bacterium]
MFTTFLALAMITAVPDSQQQRDPETCLELLEGSWLADLAPNQSVLMKIDGDEAKLFSILNEKRMPQWTCKLHLSKTLPENHMDWRQRRSSRGPLSDNQCLYRLEGNTLLLIGGGPNERPTKFLSGKGGEPRTIVFTRIEGSRPVGE